MKARLHLVSGVLIVLLLMQLTFAFTARSVVVPQEMLPPAPTQRELMAVSFGDPQFLFRVWALHLQNVGQSGGEVTPIRAHNFDRVVAWLRALQSLDSRSDFTIGIADGYFGQSQDVEHVRPIVKFMQEHVALDPVRKWNWLYQAIYLALHRLKDEELALDVARQLASYDDPSMPPWPSMTPAFILENRGDFPAARTVIEETKRKFAGRLTPDDQKWADEYLDYLKKREMGLISPR